MNEDNDKLEFKSDGTVDLYPTDEAERIGEVSVVAPRSHGKGYYKKRLEQIDALYSKKSAEAAIEDLTNDVRERLKNVMTDKDINEIIQFLDQIERLVENEMEMSSEDLNAQTLDGFEKSSLNNNKYGSQTKSFKTFGNTYTFSTKKDDDV